MKKGKGKFSREGRSSLTVDRNVLKILRKINVIYIIQYGDAAC